MISRLSRADARDLGYAIDAVKPFEDLTAYELARRVRVERAAAIGGALAALITGIVRLPAQLLALAQRARQRPVASIMPQRR